MVLWMSMYNVTLHMGGFSTEVLREGWLGFPIAVVFAFCMDWFVVSGPAKGVAFRFFVNRDSSVLKKVIVISTCMVVPMVIIMSFYGGLEACVRSGQWNLLLIIWLTNIPKNLYYGAAFPADRCGTVSKNCIQKPVPGRKSAGLGKRVPILLYHEWQVLRSLLFPFLYTKIKILQNQDLQKIKNARDGIRTRGPHLGKVVLHP